MCKVNENESSAHAREELEIWRPTGLLGWALEDEVRTHVGNTGFDRTNIIQRIEIDAPQDGAMSMDVIFKPEATLDQKRELALALIEAGFEIAKEKDTDDEAV